MNAACDCANSSGRLSQQRAGCDASKESLASPSGADSDSIASSSTAAAGLALSGLLLTSSGDGAAPGSTREDMGRRARARGCGCA
eukprot:5810122-Prymnesium_polylepis.1